MKSGFRLFLQGNLTKNLEEQNIFVVYSEPTEAYPSEIQFYKRRPLKIGRHNPQTIEAKWETKYSISKF